VIFLDLTNEQIRRNDFVDNTAFDLLQEARENKRFIEVFNGPFDETLAKLYDGFDVMLSKEKKESIYKKAVQISSQMEWNEADQELEWDMFYIAELLDELEDVIPEDKQMAFRPYVVE
jgi:sRNA-binding regulator protein Hfq